MVPSLYLDLYDILVPYDKIQGNFLLQVRKLFVQPDRIRISRLSQFYKL